MRLLKSYLISIVICHLSFAGYCQLNVNHIYSQERINQLISADSIYEVTLLLNEDINSSKANKLPLSLAYTNEKLGDIFSSIESYETAEVYYAKAIKLFDSLQKPDQVDNTLTKLTRNYVDAKNYEKFDSIIPIALNYSHQLNSLNIFYNLGSKIIKCYSVKNYEGTKTYTDEALVDLGNHTFDTEKDQSEKHKLRMSFLYYKALAMINLNQFDEGYKLLFKIDPNQFSDKVQHNRVPLSQIATLNFYKFRYFNERTKHVDSANNYLWKSDSLKYIVIKEFHNKLARNGDLIYKIIKTENQLQLANSKRTQDRLLYNAFLLSTIVLSLLLIALGILFYYYYSNRKHIKTINLRLKESNKKLKLIDKERLEFFSILSHELRTPIYGINGLATLIGQEESLEKRKGYLNALISSSNYISVLIDNVLQISKLKFKNKKLFLKPTNIVKLVQRISTSIKISADQKGLKFYTKIEKNIGNDYLLVDQVVLSQILINLTYNAIKYTCKGHVTISIIEQRRTATLVNLLFEIKDSGIGIKNKHNDIIFNAFENKTFLEKNSSGSGLGLHIVKTLLKSYNSEIKFTSKPNEGSTFFFDIDFKIAEVKKPSVQPSFPVLDQKSKILIVDDNHINLLITQKNVERISGCFSETATRGEEAICLIKEKDFDMVLMDINMPDMDGYEATKHIRLFNPTIPIVALTALNSAEIQNKAKSCGMNHVITKPYEFEEFKSVILKYSHVIQHSSF